MSGALSNLKDHASSLSSATDVRDAVQSHLPSVDMDSMREMARDKTSGKRPKMAILIGAIAAAAAIAAILRRRS